MKKNRLKKIKWVLVGLGCLLALGVITLTEENIRTKYNWNTHKYNLEQEGEKFDMASIIPQVPPESQNFAMTPLLKPIMEFKHTKESTVWQDTNGYNRVSGVRSELPSTKGNNSKAGSIEKGTFADLETFRTFFRGNTNYNYLYTNSPAGTTAAEDILIALGRFDEEINELRNAALTRPLGYFPTKHNTNEASWGIMLPYLIHVKGLAILFQLHGVATSETGHELRCNNSIPLNKSRVALEDFIVCLRLSDTLKNTPLLIDHLVRIATLQLTAQGIREALWRHTWDELQLLELEKHLASINLLSELKVSLRGERALNVASIEHLRKGTGQVKEMGEVKVWFSKFAPMVSCMFYENMMSISKLHQDLIDTCMDESRGVMLTNRSGDLEKFMAKQTTPYNILTKKLMPAYGRVTIKTAKVQSTVNHIRVACALERYWLAKNQQYPSTLNELVPAFMTKIPIDVMDGKPMRYRQTPNDGYVLYSIGWNCVDDGGITGFKENKETGKKSPNAESGDWIYPMTDSSFTLSKF